MNEGRKELINRFHSEVKSGPRGKKEEGRLKGKKEERKEGKKDLVGTG